jgi:hypothetical protein
MVEVGSVAALVAALGVVAGVCMWAVRRLLRA